MHATQFGACIQFSTPFGCSANASNMRFPGRENPNSMPSSEHSTSFSSAGPSSPSEYASSRKSELQAPMEESSCPRSPRTNDEQLELP
eukprot:scaffold3942_cov123-Isochrysis_galbana.AAC.10